MTSASDNPRMAAWVGDDLVPILERMLDGSVLGCSCLGGDGPVARAFAASREIPFVDDARVLALADGAATVIMNPSARLSFEVLEAMVRATGDANRPLLAMTPRPGLDRDQIVEAGEVFAAGPPPTPFPLFRSLETGRRFVEAAGTFGRPASATIEIAGPAMQGALGTRLFDAFDMLSVWFGIPATVQAVSVRAPSSGDSRIVRVMANAIYPDGRAASVVAGSDGGRVHRSVTLHGEGGRLHSCHGSLDWSDRSGTQLELGEVRASRQSDFAEELSEAIVATIGGTVTGQPLEATINLLAACEAVFLSGRTGEPESCESVRQMLGRV